MKERLKNGTPTPKVKIIDKWGNTSTTANRKILSLIKELLKISIRKQKDSPGQCGSVGWSVVL